MKAVLALCAIAMFVIAEDVFFYDHNTGMMVHRTSDSCYVWTLSADQQANVHNHTIYLEYEQLMRDKVAGGDTGTAMTAGDAPDFVAHHCHNKNLFSLS